MRRANVLVACLIFGASVELVGAEECEVCVDFLERLYRSLVATHSELSPAIAEEALIQACAVATGKENRLCYYVGASSDAAARVTADVARPLSSHVPVPKICQRLQKRDVQICELRHDKPVLDWSREILSNMRVLELKRILASWGEECRACLEKNEFVDLIQELHDGSSRGSGGRSDATRQVRE
ncbi:cerebral dopamine neurotrophic factor [Denticeps clupeoides]|uniref:Cerebral dopamine neurotrophic factor n=1 Tax=Denticeps clupeoides TaxID=299321 RepID=A0AAY4D773_9TELE|nr:cerebral dopamine neurotrophic factor-like [Denticeps clupeoides]